MNLIGKTKLFALLTFCGFSLACCASHTAAEQVPKAASQIVRSRIVIRPEERLKIEEAIPAKVLVAEFGIMLGARGANHRDSDEHVFIKIDDPAHPVNQPFGARGFDYRDEL